MDSIDLIVMAPTFNEGKVAKKVIEEWHASLNALSILNYRFLLVDDGSTDNTSEISRTAEIPPENLIILQKENSGHGKSCIWGYRKALELNPKWILQIDSDGQCDPNFFSTFWNKRSNNPIIYGYRKTRKDGFSRLIISRIISFFIFLCTMRFSRDPNVPYRLFQCNVLNQLMQKDYEVELSNMLLTYEAEKRFKILWVNINFRDRLEGKSTHKIFKSITMIFQLVRKIG